MTNNMDEFQSGQINYDSSSVKNAMRCLKNMQALEENPNFGKIGDFESTNRYYIENYIDRVDSKYYTNTAIETLVITMQMLGNDSADFNETGGLTLLNFENIGNNGNVLDYIEENFEEYEILDNGCYAAKDATTGDRYVFPSNFTGEAITVGVFIPGQGNSSNIDGVNLLVSGYKESGVPDDFIFISARDTRDSNDVLSFCDEFIASSGVDVGTVKVTGFSGGGDAALRAVGNYKQSHPNVKCEALLMDPYEATGKNGNSMYASDYPDLSRVSLFFVDIGGTGSYNRIENDIIANGFINAVHYENQRSISHGMCVKETFETGLYNMFMFGNSSNI